MYLLKAKQTRVRRQFQQRKNSLCNKRGRDKGVSTSEGMKLDPSLTPHIKTDSKCIRDLNVKSQDDKTLREKKKSGSKSLAPWIRQ